ncbi:MAG TPA: hypothetical protein VMR66_07960 [Gemmatimonadota bacterium]|nr:hypothetical protein [Gemmatimonadota bacterium]
MARCFVLAWLLLLAAAPAARSQGSHRGILEDQLAAVGNTVAQQGWRPDARAFRTDLIVGFLFDDEEIGLEIDLEFGVEYMIVGVCDQDCSDLDLMLGDVEGNELFTDALDDDAPILTFTAPARGSHILWVSMYECLVEPCSFGYKVYRR